MKHFIYFLLLSIITLQLKSQCFEIESILVDACAGSQEGQNEMVTFRVGSVALNTANLSVSWPNNPWKGLTQNAGTAADVATVNSTISGCGFLKEPVGGVLPANSKVLLITSTAWSPLAQSFVNLTDTLIVIFQTAGNTAGHFANFGTGLRTLTMTFSSPSGCSDAVTYDRAQLINQAGNLGAQDGGAVEFLPSGTASYVNHGCQAPYIPLSLNAGPDKTVCAGSSQNFTATASGSYSSVQWSLGVGATGSFAPTNSLVTTYTPGNTDNGTIKLYCTILKACGTQTATVKDSVLLTVTPLPTVTVNPTSVNICAGQSATVQANANTSVTYTWSTSAHTNSVVLNSAGIYTVNVSNTCGFATATVNVNISASPTASITSSSSSLCSGQSATLSLSGSTGTYSWSNGATTSTTTVNTSGVYTATVTAAGCGAAAASVSITALPSPTVSISSSGPTQICSGSSVILTANSSEPNYLWSDGSTTQTVSVNTATTIVVTSTNTCGSAQATETITIIPLPTVTVNPNTVSLCTGQSATVQANANTTVTYTWSTGGNTNTVSLNTAGIYTVDVSNTCGTASATVSVSSSAVPSITATASQTAICNSGQSTQLSLSGSVGTYSWSNGATTATTSVNTPGVYTVTVTTAACGSATASVSIAALPSPTVSISTPTTSICPGSHITLTANSSDGNYLWSNGVTTQTVSTNAATISVTTTNTCGSASANQTLSFIPLPTVSITPGNILLCPGSTATLTASGNPANYIWSTGASTNVIYVNTAGVKTVSVSNACGTATASVNVTPLNFPPLSVTASAMTVCPNEIVTYSVTGGGFAPSGSVTYDWSNSTSTGSVVSGQGGTVTVSNSNVCGTYTASIVVAVNPVTANITANPIVGSSPLDVSFTNNSTNATTYLWDFGNGTIAHTQTVTSQVYYNTGSYTVYLTVTNGLCMDVDSVVIVVLEEEPTLYVPNAFTPNGDSINDFFRIGATNIIDFNIVIFDRWGLKLYESNDIYPGWDGKVNGNVICDGVYFYLIEATGIDKVKIKKQGTVTLFK